MAKILGIDEAGRGPVIGPMVVCGVLIEDSDVQNLKALGVKDSKLLTPKKRRELFDYLVKNVKYGLRIISPAVIDEFLFSLSEKNLNWLEADVAVDLINEFNPDKVVVDCPSPNIKAFRSYILERLDHKGLSLVVEHKADFKYVVVSAASVIAKVTRDAEIEKLKKRVGFDFGSGYMSDPRTRDFLKKAWKKHKDIFRQSWAPYRELKKGESQATLV
ncbi:ribonuclease HII [Candidatus Woesearchaeota archaeon]|nr:MAG: ribonuclease HII [Candidatus Woesearchaeota archaeon]